MEKKTRRIIFFIFVFLFLLSAPLVVLYSQGYRFDFENKKLTQTGGIFLKALPKQAEIYIDEGFSRKTDFFFGSILIEELLPKKYNIKVKKEGYFEWEKNLEVKEKEVVEAKEIILFPKDADFSFLSNGIKNLWFSPEGKRMVWEEKEGNLWSLKLYDLNKNLKSHLLKESDVSKKGAEFFDLEFSKDGKEIYFKVITAEQLKSFALEIDKIPPVLKEIKESSLLPENIITYEEFNNDIYYLDNLGYLYKTDASFSLKEKVTTAFFPLKKETGYELYVFPDFIFLEEGGEILYLLNQETKIFERFFEGINSLKISSDSKKLVYCSDSEIRVLFLKEKTTQPTRKIGESIFLVRLSEKINDVFWLMSRYLIFNTENKIKIAEIDNRDRINIIDLAEFENSEIFWNPVDKKLYVLVGENLWASKNLIP